MKDYPLPGRYNHPPTPLSLTEYVDELDARGGEDSMPYVVPVLVRLDLWKLKRFNAAVELYVKLGWFRPDAPFRKIRDESLKAPDISTSDRSSFLRHRNHEPVAAFMRGLVPYRTDVYTAHVDRVKRQRRGGMPMND